MSQKKREQAARELAELQAMIEDAPLIVRLATHDDLERVGGLPLSGKWVRQPVYALFVDALNSVEAVAVARFQMIKFFIHAFTLGFATRPANRHERDTMTVKH